MKKETLKKNTEKLLGLLLDGEAFKPYNGNENVDKDRFYVSNLARCWDMERGVFVNDSDNPKYEYSVWFCCSTHKDKDYKFKAVRIHRAVAELFVPVPKRLKGQRIVVDHINGNKKDNRAENLRWLTYAENANAQDVQQRKAANQKRTMEEKKRALAFADALADSNEKTRNLSAQLEQMKERLEEAEERAMKGFNEAMQYKMLYETQTPAIKMLEDEIRRLNDQITSINRESWKYKSENAKLKRDNTRIQKDCEVIAEELDKARADVLYFVDLLDKKEKECEKFRQKVISDVSHTLASLVISTNQAEAS